MHSTVPIDSVYTRQRASYLHKPSHIVARLEPPPHVGPELRRLHTSGGYGRGVLPRVNGSVDLVREPTQNHAILQRNLAQHTQSCHTASAKKTLSSPFLRRCQQK